MKTPPFVQVSSDQKDGLWVFISVVQTKNRFVPLSSTEFIDEDSPKVRLQITKDPDGRITGLRILNFAPQAPVFEATKQL